MRWETTRGKSGDDATWGPVGHSGPLPTRHLPPARTPDRNGRWPAAGRATGVTPAPWPVFSLLPPAAQLRHSPARKARPRAPAPV